MQTHTRAHTHRVNIIVTYQLLNVDAIHWMVFVLQSIIYGFSSDRAFLEFLKDTARTDMHKLTQPHAGRGASREIQIQIKIQIRHTPMCTNQKRLMQNSEHCSFVFEQHLTFNNLTFTVEEYQFFSGLCGMCFIKIKRICDTNMKNEAIQETSKMYLFC